MLATNIIFIDLLRVILPKLLVKFQPHAFDFLNKGRKSAKNAEIMHNYGIPLNIIL